MLNQSELKVVYKLLNNVELTESEKAIASHLIIKFEIEYKIKL